jgi:hypothetical protein
MFLWNAIMVCLVTGCATRIDRDVYSNANEQLLDPGKCLEVVVESDPSGVSVFGVKSPGFGLLKNEEPNSYLGKTPLTLRYTRVGPHVFGTKPDETLEVRETSMTPIKMAEAYLAFRCFLLKDGYEAQMVTKIVENRELDQPTEPARVTALDGGKRVTVKTILKPADVTHTRLCLAELQGTKPVAMLPKVKGISVTSIPDGAEVYVDGSFVGNAPCTLPLEPGLHDIELRMQGFDSFSRQLRVFKGTSVTVKGELIRISESP